MRKHAFRLIVFILCCIVVCACLSACHTQNVLANTPAPTITPESGIILVSTPSPTPKPMPTPIKFPTKGYINAEGVNLRTEPGTDSEVVDILGENVIVNVLSLEDDWYRIKFEDISAYAAKHLITLGDPPRPDNMRTGIVTRDSTLYYSTSANDIVKDAEGNVITVPADTQIRVLRTIGTFCHIVFDGTQRYIVKPNVKFID